MDYDDNDFQNQNLHLAGEGSTKFPPLLRPYALPKFDFDESLQGHLRFDSLVETEVFLGIDSNEDNQWIDAYSRGSSTIEFSSTAAESCSISRHNNVWSEATSSESVEMLLKSVGQEEFIPRQATMLESDACDEQACLTKQMESNPKPDDKNEFKVTAVDSQTPGCVDEKLSGSKDNVEMEQSLAGPSQGNERSIDGSSSNLQPQDNNRNTDLRVPEGGLFTDAKNCDTNKRQVETGTDGSPDKETRDGNSCHLPPQNIDLPVPGVSLFTDRKSNDTSKRQVDTLADGFLDKETHDGSSTLLRPQYIHRNIDLPLPGDSHCTDVKNNDTNNSEVWTLADGSLDKETQDVSSTSGVKTNITAAFPENISSTFGVSNIQNGQNQVVGRSDDGQSSSRIQTDKQDVGSSVINNESDVDTQTLDGNAVGCGAHHTYNPLCSVPEEGLETGMSNFVDSFRMVSDGTSDLQKDKTCCEDTCVRDLPQGNASEDAVMEDQSALRTCDSLKVIAINDDSSSKDLAVKVYNSCQWTSPSFQQNVDTIEKKHGESSVCNENMLLEIGHHMDKEILLSKSEASKFSVVDNNVAVVGGSNSDKEGGDLSSFNVVASTKPCILGEAAQLCENNEPDRHSDHGQICKDVSINNHESKKAPLDSSEMHCDVYQSHLVVKGSGSSSLRACSLENELTTSTALAVDVMPVNSSASNLTSETISSTSCEVDVPPIRIVSAHEVTDQKEIQRTMLVEPVCFDVKEKSEAKIAEIAELLSLVVSTKHEISPSPATGTETHNPSDTPRQPLCETISIFLQNPGTTATEKIEPEGTLNYNVNLESTKEVGVAPDQCESTEKLSDEDTVPFINDDKEKIEENHHKSPSKFSGPVSSSHVPDSHIELHETGGSPTYLTNSTCSPSITFGSTPETEKTGNQVKASCSLNSLVSDINTDATHTSTPVHDPKGNVASKDERGLTSEENRVSNLSQKVNAELFTKVKASCSLNSPVSDLNTDATNTLTPAHDPKGNDASKDERSLTSEVSPVANSSQKVNADLTTEGKDVVERLPLPLTAANKAPMVLDESPLASGLGTAKTKIAASISHGCPPISDGEVTHSVSKGTPELKTRRVSTKTPGKESSRKRRQAKEKPLARQSEKGGGSTSVSLSPPPGFQRMHSNEVQQYGHSDSNSTKPFAVSNASTSGLPDLNTSASLPILFQQPFTDIQQIQLRAQIFVYGALIQGIVPDKAHMVAAFGGQDGGRSMWESVWCSFIERQHGQKSHPGNPETPLQSRSGSRTTDLTVKGKAMSSPLGRASNKATPPIVNPSIPLSSPVWSLLTPSRDSLQSNALARGSVVDYAQTLTSLHPYQTPPRSFLGHTTSWISQAPPRGPWIASPYPAPDNSSHLSTSPVTETIKLSSVKGSSLPPSSAIKNVPPSLPASSACLQSISVATTPLLDTGNVMASHAQHSSDPKPKKRKKVMISEDLGQKVLQSHTQLQATPDFSSHISTAVEIATPVGNVPVTTVEKSVVSVSPMSLVGHSKSDWNVENRILSDETLKKVKEARINAEDASALSAAAVNHSLEIWKQLDNQRNSGLVSEIETKLASAAVAVAAAAAVAKAAAAAANVASNAALQAKLMVDEALVLSDYENSRQFSSPQQGMSDIGKATPASILKGSNGTSSSSSIIVAAKEAARKRVDSASAARIQAENMDAIVKAAELAAEAVSQAGKIVTMGDPLPLSDLVEAGPEGCWNAAQESSQQAGALEGMTRGLVNIDNVGDRPESSRTCNRDISSDETGKQIVESVKSPLHMVHDERPQDPVRSIDGISTSINTNRKSSRGSKRCKASDLVNPIDVLPGSGTEIQASLAVDNRSDNMEENNMKEGSLVEVFKDGGELKAAWFTGNILSLKDDKAYVGYSVLLADEGVGPLKEWVSLKSEGDKPPKIRIARPLTGLHNEGTRKRRRTIMVDYTWSVGDNVDAWIQESWQEGVITDKNKKDETTLTVHFPSSGETSFVRTWHLRPSLIWKDGKWIEPSRMGAKSSSTHEGDTPNEKRPKLGSHAVEVKGKEKISKGVDAVEPVNDGVSSLLNLAENEKVFNVGSKNENKPNAQRMVRSGHQKEGSRVISGIPKLGKKRKYMDVSKHYVAGGTGKINDGNDSVKLANFLIPRGSGSRKTDAKEKVGADTKLKTFKSGKPMTAFGRVIPPKENSLSKTRSNDMISRRGIKDSPKNASVSSSHSGTSGAVGGSILYSSHATSADSQPTKKASTSRASEGKLAPAGRALGKVEAERALVKSTSEVVEPRRSNRRIQPTSRLLEGLQSSLIISKIPSGPHHDKGHNTHNRNASKR
ncbi:putative transcription factor interactor and regulator C3H-WRC/GRF family [Lupinus albus]|uniref:Putative transcription factor interactor and regulator C3H-WRC/GRF family n=1 Tax=Lupinus albus TaxID=3870 RepID=A0A6A4Q0G1_LUPAL|nr:putative transcription factor interactor and regulator C3H-WRC/GRF family [Lupinus albus]